MSKNLSAKYYQGKKERLQKAKKQQYGHERSVMVSQKIKNKILLSIE